MLSSQSREVSAERDSLVGQVSKLQLELQLANRSIEERLMANKQLTSDLSILSREKQNLHIELERMEKRLADIRDSTDIKVCDWVAREN